MIFMVSKKTGTSLKKSTRTNKEQILLKKMSLKQFHRYSIRE